MQLASGSPTDAPFNRCHSEPGTKPGKEPACPVPTIHVERTLLSVAFDLDLAVTLTLILLVWSGHSCPLAFDFVLILGGAAVYRCDPCPTFSRGFSRRGTPLPFILLVWSGHSCPLAFDFGS
jgi:hypothetical protein